MKYKFKIIVSTDPADSTGYDYPKPAVTFPTPTRPNPTTLKPVTAPPVKVTTQAPTYLPPVETTTKFQCSAGSSDPRCTTTARPTTVVKYVCLLISLTEHMTLT